MVLVEILADSEHSLHQREEEKKDWLPYILFCILSSRVISSREIYVFLNNVIAPLIDWFYISYTQIYLDLFDIRY